MSTATLTPASAQALPPLVELQTAGFHAQSSFQQVMAAAESVGGFTVRQDYLPYIRNYLRRETIFWPLLRKEPARTDLVQELREESHPQTAFFDKNQAQPPETPSSHPTSDASTNPDPGQRIKAAGGVVEINHYGRSLLGMQGDTYGDQMAKKTNDLFASTSKTVEWALFAGDASANPLSFNGVGRQMAGEHTKVADKREGHVVYRKLRRLVRLAVTQFDIARSITHIFTSGLGLELIEEEMDAKLEYCNLDVVRPGLRVPGLNTQGDSQGAATPIITSPYLQDRDMGEWAEIDYWLVDMNTLCWKGVYPVGGQQTFEPQILEVSYYADGSEYLVQKRICLIYGTLYAENRGEGIWKLTVKVRREVLTDI